MSHAWKRLYCPPHSRDPGGPPYGLGKLSTRDQYRLARSMERFQHRADAFLPSEGLLLQGELGTLNGFRIIKS